MLIAELIVATIVGIGLWCGIRLVAPISAWWILVSPTIGLLITIGALEFGEHISHVKEMDRKRRKP